MLKQPQKAALKANCNWSGGSNPPVIIMQLLTNYQPISVGGSAVYPYSKELAKTFTVPHKFDPTEQIRLYREVKVGNKHMLLAPRQLCPKGHMVPDNRKSGLDVDFASIFKPRNDEQARVVAETVGLLKQEKNFIVQAPTGFGKTAVSMDIVAEIGKQTLVVVTKEDIRDQWIEAAQKFLQLSAKEIGLIQGDTFSVHGKKLVIAMIQTLSKSAKFKPNDFDTFGLVIYDEVHRVGADHFSNSVYFLPAKLRIGLSATPTRKDGRDIVLKAHIGDTLVSSEAMNMVPKVLFKKTGFRLPQVKRKVNGYWKMVKLPHSAGKTQHINKLLLKDVARNKLIASFVRDAYEVGRNVIIFSELKDHLQALYDECVFQKISTGDMAFYVGGMKKEEREAAKKKRILFATYQMTSEATDIPKLDTAVLATPRSDVVQTIGRILRVYPDKPKPVVFDLIDSDSSVFEGYFNKRLQWYSSIGAEVKSLG